MTVEVSDDAKAVAFMLAVGFASLAGLLSSLFGSGHGETGWVLMPFLGMTAFLLLEIVSPLWSSSDPDDVEVDA